MSVADEVGELGGLDELGGLSGLGGEDVTVTICPDGPLLVRGPAQVRTVDGRPVEHDRTVLALCRCGRSRLKPLCDGSHRLSRFRDPATAEQMTHVLAHATPYDPTEGPDAA